MHISEELVALSLHSPLVGRRRFTFRNWSRKHPAGALCPPATTPSHMSSIWETTIDLVESPAKGQQHLSPSTENESAVRKRSATLLRNCTESKIDLRERILGCRAAAATRAYFPSAQNHNQVLPYGPVPRSCVILTVWRKFWMFRARCNSRKSSPVAV